MNYLNATEGSRRATGIAAAVLVHVVLLYTLITGSALRVIEVIREPFETRIIAEPQPSPPAEKAPAPPRPARPRVAPHASPPPASLPTVPVAEVPAPPAVPAEAAITTTAVPAPAAAPSPGPVRAAPPSPSASVQLEGCALPEYPAASITAEETGTVALSFLVDADGQVLESRVDRSSGYRRLDEAARRALGRCKFRPAYVDGKPRQAWAHIKYVWRLE
jgi:periplasmic protein TonB